MIVNQFYLLILVKREYVILLSCAQQKGINSFFMIATDLRIASGKEWDAVQAAGSKSIIVWDSNDLVNWSEPRMIEKWLH